MVYTGYNAINFKRRLLLLVAVRVAVWLVALGKRYCLPEEGISYLAGILLLFQFSEQALVT